MYIDGVHTPHMKWGPPRSGLTSYEGCKYLYVYFYVHRAQHLSISSIYRYKNNLKVLLMEWSSWWSRWVRKLLDTSSILPTNIFSVEHVAPSLLNAVYLVGVVCRLLYQSNDLLSAHPKGSSYRFTRSNNNN